MYFCKCDIEYNSDKLQHICLLRLPYTVQGVTRIYFALNRFKFRLIYIHTPDLKAENKLNTSLI